MPVKKRNLPDVGHMNKRVELQHKSGVSDGGGGNEWVWSTFRTVWASVNDSGGVIYGSVNEHRETVHDLIFVIRYNSDIYSKPITAMKLVYNDRRFKIRNIRNLNQSNRYLEITCDGNDFEAI